ncbi:MAG TPA: 50S ribosomal protein L28 [Treponemataceae bacterium]|nr:50S ribosomal protein L28 [Treponemataceae bacterium]
MSRKCEICGKGSMSGNKVSKSYNHSRRLWKPNIVAVKTEIGGTTMTIKMCARCLKSGYVTKKV